MGNGVASCSTAIVVCVRIQPWLGIGTRLIGPLKLTAAHTFRALPLTQAGVDGVAAAVGYQTLM